MYDLLYLNYLYICFCRKIEKVLSAHIRPEIFAKIFYRNKTPKIALRQLIIKKEMRYNLKLLRRYWDKWVIFFKFNNIKDRTGRHLIDFRASRENKLSILLAFFNKWRYLTRISAIPDRVQKIYPTNKLNGFFKILDSANKYIKQKALKQIINKLLDYLIIKAKETKLKKITLKIPKYEKITLRKYLYLWYSKILSYQQATNAEEANKILEMRRKIFRLLVTSVKRRINRRILRKYFIQNKS